MILLTQAPVVTDPGVEEPPPLAVSPDQGLTITWSAPWLDRTWTWTDPDSPVARMVGASMTGMADPQHRFGASPLLSGSTWEGQTTGAATPFDPLVVQADTSEDFLARHREFMQALDPEHESVVRVILPDGSWRECSHRYNGGAATTIDVDPVLAKVATYVVQWVCADPFWRGPEIIASYPFTEPAPFFPGPPFLLAPNRSLSRANITNPGDVGSHPVWRVDGPATSFSVGIGDALVRFGTPLLAGESISIDMTPDELTILDGDGVDRWDDVTDVAFEQIPPGVSELVTSLVAAGPGSAVTLTFTPRYRTAW